MITSFARIFLPTLIVLALAGCGSQFGFGAPEAEPTPIPVPTFTPTPATSDAPAEPSDENAEDDEVSGEPEVVILTVTPEPIDESDKVAEVAAVAEADPAASPAAEETTDAPDGELILLPTPTSEIGVSDAVTETADALLPTATASSDPLLIVNAEFVNVRGGPGTGYAIVGATTQDEEFAITGRNEAGDWWQVCCFAEAPGWLYSPLVELRNEATVALATDIPPLPTPEPVAEVEDVAEEVAETPAEEIAAEETAPAEPVSTEHSGTAGNFDPNAQYQIVNYRVIGYGENNGGIFDNGGQHMIFVNVIDANGNGIDGAVIRDAVDNKINIVTGTKGPGRAEFEMFWERYKIFVAEDPSGPVTSQISNQMNTAYPHVPDIIGKLGPAENEYAICPTPDDRCEPPFFHAHWSYEITFQKVK